MSETIKILWSFIKLIIKKWFLLVVFYGSLIGAIFTFRIFNIEVPSYVFWILTLIGLFWASFRVYKKLYIDYEREQKKYTDLKKSIIGTSNEAMVKPELTIKLLEGNEYTYSISKKGIDREKFEDIYLTPDAFVELHFRILNTGTTDLDIISIEAIFEYHKTPWSFWPPQVLKEKGEEIHFPRHLNVDEILLCNLINTARVFGTLNDAQFAAQLVGVDKNSTCAKSSVVVEATDTKGDIHKFSLSFELALRPLMDLYISRWQEKDQTDLLRLARAKGKIKNIRKPKINTAKKTNLH